METPSISHGTMKSAKRDAGRASGGREPGGIDSGWGAPKGKETTIDGGQLERSRSQQPGKMTT